MNEQQPPHHEDEHDEIPPDASPWDPDEQVGDIYVVDIDQHGHVQRAEKLQPRPSIWVGSWLDYNNGILHGQWIDAAREADDVWTDIRTMLAASPTARKHGEVAEEWGIFDHDHFGPLQVGEQADIDYVTAVARGIAEHGPAFAAWADHVGDDRDRLGDYEEAFLGTYDSLTAYAEQLVEDLGYQDLIDEAVPESLRPYIRFDAEALALDMRLSGEIAAEPAPDGGVWVFDARQ